MRRERLDESAFEESDHRAEWKTRRGKWKAFFASSFARSWSGYLASTWLIAATVAQGEEQAPPAEWRVWLEAKFTHAPVTTPLPGAEKTELAAGTRDAQGDAYLLKPQFAELKVEWAEFLTKARENANADLAELKPTYVRDRKQVIEYAILRSERPIVASAVFASKFLPLFKETLGDKVLVVVPNRYQAFVFPSLASHYEEYAPMIFAAYRATAFPVSVEVFEVSAEGWKAGGIYEEP